MNFPKPKTLKKALAVTLACLLPGGAPLPAAAGSKPDWNEKPQPWGKNWANITSEGGPVCGNGQKAKYRREDYEKLRQAGARIPIYCWIASSHAQDAAKKLSAYDSVISPYELTLDGGRPVAVRNAGGKEERIPVIRSRPNVSGADQQVIVRLVEGEAAAAPPKKQLQDGEKVPAKKETPAGETKQAAPAETEKKKSTRPAQKPADVAAAISKLFSDNKVEAALVGHILGKYQGEEKEKRERDLLDAAAKPEADASRRAVTDLWRSQEIGPRLVDLFQKAPQDPRERWYKKLLPQKDAWLAKAEEKLAAGAFLSGIRKTLGSKKLPSKDLLTYFCKNRSAWATAVPAPGKDKGKFKDIPKDINEIGAAKAAKDNVNAIEAAQSKGAEAAGDAAAVGIDGSGSFEPLCAGADAALRGPVDTKHGGGGNAGSNQPPPNPSVGSGSELPKKAASDNSNMLKNIAGGTFGALAFGLFGVAAFGPMGLVLGAVIGAVVGAAAVHFSNNPIGEKK